MGMGKSTHVIYIVRSQVTLTMANVAYAEIAVILDCTVQVYNHVQGRQSKCKSGKAQRYSYDGYKNALSCQLPKAV